MARPDIPEALRAGARAALAADRNVRAVLLYGSRARGDHGPGSDWDIAVLTRRGGWRLCWREPVGWGKRPEFETPFFLCLSEGELRLRKDAVGHPAFAVARDGVLLAGSWRRPVPGRPLPVGTVDYARMIDMVLRNLMQAVYGACRLLTEPVDPVFRRFCSAHGFLRDCHWISRQSGWAASGLAVAALARFATPGTRKRSPEWLARSIPDPALAAVIAGLGGPIAEEDERGEPACRPEDIEAALVRIARIAESLPAELLAAARAPQLRRLAPGHALRQARRLRRMAGDLREARLELAAGGPVPADLAVSARALEAYDRMAPAFEEAARGLMAMRSPSWRSARPTGCSRSATRSIAGRTPPRPCPGSWVRTPRRRFDLVIRGNHEQLMLDALAPGISAAYGR